ncbi:MAG: ArgE/DapE family deacylase, partial [Calditrichaeota bacterium]
NLSVEILESDKEKLKRHPAFTDDGIAFEQRLNVIGRWPGSHARAPSSSAGGSLILNGHVDVVSPGDESLWVFSPWSGQIQDGKLYGRGACDMKAGLACAIFAIQVLQALGFQPQHEIILESVIGEETGGIGTLTTLIEGIRADAAIIMEPTQLKLCPVQAGALTFRLKVEGKAIHACMKNKGVSAIEVFCTLLQALKNFDKTRHRQYHNSLYPDPMNVAPISIGTIRGGTWHSTVPEQVEVEGRFGIFPGESADQARRAFANFLQETAKDHPWLQQHPPRLQWFEGCFESGETPPDAPILKTLATCHEAVTGVAPRREGVTYGADLRLFTRYAGIPAVLYGPGDVALAHSANEFILLEDITRCTRILALTLYQWCGGQ